MKILMVSTYELGRQPLHVASPAAALRRAGHEVRALDTSVDPFDDEAVAWADAVAFSVYMHTSMRLAMAAARGIREAHPTTPVCFYGLYAPVSRDLTVGTLADVVIAGEYEPGLVDWADALAAGAPEPGPGDGFRVHLGRSDSFLPARDLLPPLDRYAGLDVGGEVRLTGAVEASHGCNQRCRHCPVPAVYDGRTQIVDVELVMADIAQLLEAGAQHITFGDPDFLSGPAHARRVIAAFAERFPGVTFDVTTKVEHVLAHPGLWPELAAAGCLFVVSAVECLNDRILGLLDKGHTAAMAADAVAVVRAHGIEPHPSFLPFTPWTTPADVLAILDFVVDHDLIPNVDPVQYSLRLLLPEGSLLLDVPELAPHLDGYDAAGLTHRWRAADPAVDDLQGELAVLAESGFADADSPLDRYLAVRARVADAAGFPDAASVSAEAQAQAQRLRPRLTEPWFCCAEPTALQLGAVGPAASP